MAYDERLAGRIRDLLDDQPDLTEQKMFGGLAFLLGGNMAIVASGKGGVLVRVGPDAAADLAGKARAEPAVMGSRPMTGWLRVDADGVRTARQLTPWVTRGSAYARSLPPKQPKRTRARTSP